VVKEAAIVSAVPLSYVDQSCGRQLHQAEAL